MPYDPRPFDIRLWSGVNKDAPTVFEGIPCWEWTRSLAGRGYGKIQVRGRRVYTHVAVYELLVGPIPPGHEIDHRCGNIRCCNPAHLEAVTHQTNIDRSPWSNKTHCPHGHEYTTENSMTDARGWRRCRTCRNREQRDRREARRVLGYNDALMTLRREREQTSD